MFNKKNILITGGTGSFGKHFTEYILKNYKPNKLIIFSRDELKQFHLKKKFKDKCMRFFIGDVRDSKRLDNACNNVNIIIHAAALKQVPVAEYNPEEFIKTNIGGAQNIINAATKNKVTYTLALSTDKAVAPINLYGATKLAADKLFIAANNIVGREKIFFSVVRYGNVVNSRGSLFPEINSNNRNKPFELTHPEMTRFFITLKNSVKFVDKCLNLMNGGEIFIPKIDSFKIIDIIKKTNPKSKFKIIGIRPGEKIHEILFSRDDARNVIEFKDYYIIKPSINMTKKINYFKNKKNQKGKKLIKENEYSSSKTSKINSKKFLKLKI